MNEATESNAARVMRILAADDGTNYDNVAVALHWATALLVVVQFGLAETWDYFPRPFRAGMQSLHISFGVIFTGVILARIIWRFMPGHQVSSLEIGWVRLASKAVHYLLYLLLGVQAVSGFFFRWAQGHPVSFFGLPIPNPFDTFDKVTKHRFNNVHVWVGWIIVILALGHAMAALYHHYILKDRVLRRMMPSGAQMVLE